jgi:hypothetical protein
MSDNTQVVDNAVDSDAPITLELVNAKIDMIGNQLNWICENLVGLFAFVQQVGSNGGGIRGIMQLMKQGPPQIKEMPDAR